MKAIDKLVRDEIEKSELTRDAPMPEGAGVRRRRSTIYSIRLAPERVTQIESAARRLDVPTSALVRGWVLAGLAAQDSDSVTGTIERLEADVRRLRELVTSSEAAPPPLKTGTASLRSR